MWTPEIPAESGFYWYIDRSGYIGAEVVYYDSEMKWVQRPGSDVPIGDCMSQKIDGVFWSEKLRMP